jgi:hypothetical protein
MKYLHPILVSRYIQRFFGGEFLQPRDLYILSHTPFFVKKKTPFFDPKNKFNKKNQHMIDKLVSEHLSF